MKGKSVFTNNEARKIRRLIEEKVRSDPDRQKQIRREIRKLGFYFSDFSSDKDGYTVYDFDSLIQAGRIKVVVDTENSSSESSNLDSAYSKQNDPRIANMKYDRDENYVLDICDGVLGNHSLRQHRFDFLRGDPNANGVTVALPVDAYYPELNLVIEYRERQHTESVRFFDKPDRITVSGVHRGEQRKIYDERRRQVLSSHGILLVEISYSDFDYGSEKRISRNARNDEDVIRRLLQNIAGKKR